MKRRTVSFLLALLLLQLSLFPANRAVAGGESTYRLTPITYNVVVDGQPYTDPDLPVLTLEANGGSNTYVPLRRFAQLMGKAVVWDAGTNTAFIKQAEVQVQGPAPTPGSQSPPALRDQYELTPVTYRVVIMGTLYTDPDLPVLTLPLNGGNNTYVPLRRFSQVMGKAVTWEAATSTATIGEPAPPAAEPTSGTDAPVPRTVASGDADADGLPDEEEALKYGTDPGRRDTDGDGNPDGGWDERREYTYTVTARVALQKPFVTLPVTNRYQDVRILRETDQVLDVELVSYPLVSGSEP